MVFCVVKSVRFKLVCHGIVKDNCLLEDWVGIHEQGIWKKFLRHTAVWQDATSNTGVRHVCSDFIPVDLYVRDRYTECHRLQNNY